LVDGRLQQDMDLPEESGMPPGDGDVSVVV
jgi:hypothetical protein